MPRLFFKIPFIYRLVVFAAYLIVIALLSLLPGDDIPEINPFSGFDKLIHLGMYLGLSMLGCWISKAEIKPARILIVLVLTSCWGLLMEFSQLEMMVGRAFEWRDEIANMVGAIAGAVTYWWISRTERRRRDLID